MRSNGNWDQVAEALSALGVGQVWRRADLRQYSRWSIGGKAALLVAPDGAHSLSCLLRYLHHNRLPHLVIGDGSNLLFDDAGVDAVVIHIGRAMAYCEVEGNRIRAGAGLWVPRLARASLLAGLEGLQHIVGIPGTVGGLVCMNGGSQRKGVGDNIVGVTAMRPDGGILQFNAEDCGFRYRTSVFQQGLVVVACELQLIEGDKGRLRREMREILASRRQRFPLKLPNCGSVFVSNPAMYNVIGPPGKAIEAVGLRGYRIGGARSSPQHANFIVNEGNATSGDVLALIHHIRNFVFEKTGYWMESEVRYVSPDGTILPAHQTILGKTA